MMYDIDTASRNFRSLLEQNRKRIEQLKADTDRKFQDMIDSFEELKKESLEMLEEDE
jgi:hypothetical protein